MNKIKFMEVDKEFALAQVSEFLKLKDVKLQAETLNESIKEMCVLRLCKAIGLTGKVNYKSDFFEFFACMMAEAICEKLNLKIHVARDELRLVKYEHINLINQIKYFLDNETVEEAFLDAFELADKFKYLIEKLKKV